MSKKRLALHFLPAFCVAIIIFSLSFQPGEASTQVTGQLSSGLADLFEITSNETTEHLTDPNAEVVGGLHIWRINLIIRSLAHFIMFGGLGLMLILGCACSRHRPTTYIAVTLGIGMSVAFVNELIKYFVPGRHFDWVDLGKDFVGLILSLVFAFFVRALVGRMRQRSSQTSLSS